MIVAVPLKLVAGVNTRFVPPTMTTVPLVAVAPVMMSGSPSGSLSLASGAMVTATSSGVVALSSTATGAALTGVTVAVTVEIGRASWRARVEELVGGGSL